MAVDDYLQMLARTAAQPPGALNVSPAVAGWLGRIQAAQAAPAIDGQFRVVGDGAPASPPTPAPMPASTAAPSQAAEAMGPNLHPVRNAILGLLAGGPVGMFQQLQATEQKKTSLARMQQVYGSLPDEYKPLFLADPQGFLTAYMKNVEPQKLAEGEMAVYGGPNGKRILNAKKLIDEKSGRPVYMTEAGPAAFDSLGGDISAKDGVILSGRTGVQGTYSSPQKLAMGEAPGAFTPTVSGLQPGVAVDGARPAIIPAAAAAGMVRAQPARGQVADMIRSKAAAAGLDEGDQDAMVRIGQLESGLRTNAPKNGSSTGLYQFHPDTFARMGGKNIADPAEQTDAAIRLYENNKAALQAAGLPATPTSLYLSHQQGLVATRALYEAHPDVPAVQAIAPIYVHQYGPQKGMQLARQAIVRNGGSADMTAGQFIGKWDAKVNAAGAPAGGGQPSPPAAGGAAPAGPAPGWQVGQPTGMAATGAPGEAGASGADYLKTLPPQLASQVKAIADGRMQFPSGFALRTPYWQGVLQAVSQYDPNFDAVNFNARAQTRKAFTSGAQGQNLTSLNTVINHLAGLHDQIDRLGNGGMTIVNKVNNAFENNGIGVNSASYRNQRARWDSVRGTLSAEIVKALAGSSGGVHDRDYWLKQFDPDKSPEALKGAVQSALDQIESRLEPLRSAYNQGMGTTDDPFQVLFPRGAATLARMRSADAAGAGKGGGELPTMGPDEAAKLPSGTRFRTTDGRVMVRH